MFLAPPDARSLKQILLNLVSNAIKFTPSGGRILISADADADTFRLTIADSGIGMTPDGVKKALEAFGQVDSSLSRKYEGTGLGLHTSHNIVTKAGGTITVDTDSNGTTFIVSLPVVQ